MKPYICPICGCGTFLFVPKEDEDGNVIEVHAVCTSCGLTTIFKTFTNEKK